MYLLKRMKKLLNIKKDGNLFIEQLLVMPIFIVSVWLIIQLILFSYSNTQLNNAASTTASEVAHHLRGNPNLLAQEMGDGDVGLEDLNYSEAADIAGAIETVAIDRMVAVTRTNNFVLFNRDEDGNPLTDGVSKDNGNFFNNKEACENDSSGMSEIDGSALCVYIEKYSSSGGDGSHSFQVIVRAKAEFNLIGNFLRVLGEDFSTFYVHGNSSAAIDMPGRFQYYQN